MVYNVRKRCGLQLATESPVSADIVSTVPESATPAAMGYAEASGIPYMEVLIKNRYIGRTFIEPTSRQRKLGVTKKFGPLTENFQGKRIVLGGEREQEDDEGIVIRVRDFLLRLACWTTGEWPVATHRKI
jgi:glutamine phosphoribosylpyrophosphate amidotransferase